MSLSPLAILEIAFNPTSSCIKLFFNAEKAVLTNNAIFVNCAPSVAIAGIGKLSKVGICVNVVIILLPKSNKPLYAFSIPLLTYKDCKLFLSC